MLKSGAVTMPPTIGAAIRDITSAPVPWPSIIGTSPARTMDLIAAATGVTQVVRALVDPEGASDYADRHPWKPQQ